MSKEKMVLKSSEKSFWWENDSSLNISMIETRTGKFKPFRVDDGFLCACGCERRVRSGKKFFSRSCAKNKPHTWTIEEENFVKKYYRSRGVEYCAEKLVKPKTEIQLKIDQLFRNGQVKYSPLEDVFLKEYYPTHGPDYCAKKLGRTKDSITGRVGQLKVQYLPRTLKGRKVKKVVESLGELLGFDKKERIGMVEDIFTNGIYDSIKAMMDQFAEITLLLLSLGRKSDPKIHSKIEEIKSDLGDMVNNDAENITD